jgi:hypothetical protein
MECPGEVVFSANTLVNTFTNYIENERVFAPEAQSSRKENYFIAELKIFLL